MAIGFDIKAVDLDIDQVKELYNAMSDLVYKDMDKQYKEKKINGSTYASTWADLMKAVVAGSMQTVASLQMKETDADRCVKESQCNLNQSQISLHTEQEAEILRESDRKTCLATADCELKGSQQTLVDTQNTEIGVESTRKDCLATAECELKGSQKTLIDTQKTEIGIESTRKDCLATAECELKETQKAKVDYEVSDSLPTQKLFTERQTEGFDDNKMQKMLEIQMNAWAMMFSSGLMTDVPSIISGDSASSLYCAMAEDVDVPCTAHQSNGDDIDDAVEVTEPDGI